MRYDASEDLDGRLRRAIRYAGAEAQSLGWASSSVTGNRPRFDATSHAADKPSKVTEKRPQLLGRDTLLPRQPMALCRGAGTPSGTPNDRSSHDKGQRARAVHHDGVSNTIYYLTNDRDQLLTRHCLRKFSWCARELPFFGCQLDTDNRYALDFTPRSGAETCHPTPLARRTEGASDPHPGAPSCSPHTSDWR